MSICIWEELSLPNLEPEFAYLNSRHEFSGYLSINKLIKLTVP